MLGDKVLWFGGEVYPKGSCGKGLVASGFGESEWTTRLPPPPQWVQKLMDYANEEVGPGWGM